MLEEGEKLQASLQEALSHRHFLMACLTLDLLEKLEKDGSEALREADTLKISLSQSLKELNQRSKQKLPDNQSSDNLQGTTTSVVAPPRKSKHSSEKKTVYPVSASASVVIQSYTTSQEPQSKTVDITDEPVTNEANKPASEDPTMMHNVTEETPAVTEETEIEQLYAENKTKDEAENKQKPSSEKSPVTGKQTKVAVEKSEIIQKGKKSKSFEVSQLAEPMFPLEKVASMQSTETKDESEKYNVTSESAETPMAKCRLLPMTRKSKSTELCLALGDTELPQTRKDPQSKSSSLDFNGENKGFVTEKKKPVPVGSSTPTPNMPEKLAQTTDVEKGQFSPSTGKSKALMSSPEFPSVAQTQSKKKPENQTSPSVPEVVKEPSEQETESKKPDLHEDIDTGTAETTDENLTEVSIMDTKSGHPKVYLGLPNKDHIPTTIQHESDISFLPTTKPVETKEEPDSQRCPLSPEVATAATEITAMNKGKRSPSKRKSKSRKASSELNSTDLPETLKEFETVDPTKETKVTTLEKPDIPPTRKTSKTFVESIPTTERHPDAENEYTKKELESVKSTTPTEMATIQTEHVMVYPTKKEEESDSQRSPVSSEVPTAKEMTAVQTEKHSPPKRKSKSRKASSELISPDLPETLKEPESVGFLKEAKITTLEKPESPPTQKTSKSLVESKKIEKETEMENTALNVQVITGKIETVAVESTELLPSERKPEIPKVSLELAIKDQIPTTKEHDSETLSVSSTERSPPKRKSKSRKASSELISADLPETSKEPQPVGSTKEVKITTLEKPEAPPIRKTSKSLVKLISTTEREPDAENEYTKREIDSVKSTTPTEMVTVQTEQVTVYLTKKEEESDNQRSPVSPEVATATTEITAVNKGKLSPPKRQAKSRKASSELISTDLPETLKEPQSVGSTKEAKITTLEKPESPPTRKTSKSLVKTKETENETERENAALHLQVIARKTETVAVESTELSPSERKPEIPKVSLELAIKDQIPTQTEHDSERLSLSSTEQVTAVVLEDVSPTQTGGKSDDVEFSIAPESVPTIERQPDAENEYTKEELDNVTSTTPSEVVTVQTQHAMVELTKKEEETDSQRSPVSPEVATATTEITAMNKGKLSPPKRKSKSRKASSERFSTDLPETLKEPESVGFLKEAKITTLEKPESPPTRKSSKSLVESKKIEKETEMGNTALNVQVIAEKTETVAVESTELSPSERKPEIPKVSLELAIKDQIPTTKEHDSETLSVSSTERSPPKRKSKSRKASSELISADLPETLKEPQSVGSIKEVKITTLEKPEAPLTQKTSKSLVESEVTEKETVRENIALHLQVITRKTETIAVESTELLPSERKPEIPKVSLELAIKDQIPTQTEHDSERLSLSSTEQVTAVALEDVSPIQTGGKSDDVEFSIAPESVPTIERQPDAENEYTKEELDNVTSTTPSEVVTVQTQHAMVELTKKEEETDSQRSPVSPEVATATTEITAMNKGKLSPPKRKSKSRKASSERF
ncbi:nascent polypeptide-associated complex subunit alpha, muscle-specific form-like [Oreochromis aureus]|uniref:nascent polypeptide-associated complex subunit alpha, muscle-specific form-like n=1 Tax=Oreochromis aureus TaxID=47969 RepID=UPI001954FE57|nr:nascent polypeptide-associated complex subunit alpha, muscle-specific form-like [Oreochromis aureus]